MDAVKCIEEESGWQPMLLLRGGGDVLDRGSSGTRGGVLEQVKLREGLGRETKGKVVSQREALNSASLSLKPKYSINTST